MKYLLLKNGQIVRRQKIETGDILIGNNRVMEVGDNIRIPTPDTFVMDVSGKFMLPGLIHYNCPILETDEKARPSTSIYLALSHGATFLMDTIKLKKDGNFKETIKLTRENCKPIVADYGFHLGSSACANISNHDLNYGYIREGITSYMIKWKHSEKLKRGQLDHLLALAAKFQLIVVCETASIKQKLVPYSPELMNAYLAKMKQIIAILKNAGCPFLFLDVTTEQELELLYSNLDPSLPVHASVNFNATNESTPGSLNLTHLEPLFENPNILLSPPDMTLPLQTQNRFIEHGKSPSFLFDILGDNPGFSASLLNKVCDMYATRPSRVFGVYPQKGTIEPGADADIIIWNPEEQGTSKTRGSNTSLLRKDINALIINGQVITDEQLTAPSRLEGRFIQRNSLITPMK